MTDVDDAPAPPPLVRTVKVWADTVSKGHVAACRGRTCQERLWFARTVATNSAMPFDGPIVAVRTEPEPGGTGRVIWHVDTRRAHHGNCQDAARFRTKSRS